MWNAHTTHTYCVVGTPPLSSAIYELYENKYCYFSPPQFLLTVSAMGKEKKNRAREEHEQEKWPVLQEIFLLQTTFWRER